jgi:hypothetical protein
MPIRMKNVRALIFKLDYKYLPCEPSVKFHILEIAINDFRSPQHFPSTHINADVVIDHLEKRKLYSMLKLH